MQNGDEASPRIRPPGRGQLVKTLITLETQCCIFWSNFVLHFNIVETRVYKTVTRLRPASISPAGRGQLVKMLITLESHGMIWSDFAYLYM